MGTYGLGEALNGALGGVLGGVRAGAGGHAAGETQKTRGGSTGLAGARFSKARSGAPHPTGAPVLRDSVEAGTFEHIFFVSPPKGETDRLLRAARRVLDAGRQLRREARCDGRALTPAEQRITTLTAASVRVFEEILTLARLNKGRVFPSYDYLTDATSLGRATVARALRILEAIGFLVRQRRFKRVEAEGPGPRYAQTSNAYRAFLPKIVQAYLPRWMRAAPAPDDALAHDAAQKEEMETMLSRLSLGEQAKAMVNGPLGKILARLGAAIESQERESHNHPQPLLDSIIKEDEKRSWPKSANKFAPDGEP